MTLDPRYLILRCHPRDTLPLSILHATTLHLLCPTTTTTVRRGPNRQRTTILIPILPSFLFLPLTTSDVTLSLPTRLPVRLHLMKRPYFAPSHPHIFNNDNPLPPTLLRSPPSVYATCTLSEITIMSSTFSRLQELLSDPNSPLRIGSEVEVTTGLLQGIVGTIQHIKTNGDITLKIKEHLGWQINTCIVNASVLRLLC